MEIYVRLNKIQQSLKVPKSNFNDFGKYKYRSCEDILESAKKILGDAVLTINDEIINMGNRFYVKSTATLTEEGQSISVSACAREAENKKGQDDAQITGSASSYARKYACNGLFAIDDTKDADATNKHDSGIPAPKKATPAPRPAPSTIGTEAIFDMINEIKTLDELADHYEKRREAIANAGNKVEINALYAERKAQIKEAT